MKWMHNFALWLLPCGFVYYCYGLYEGAGLSGWLIRWQIETWGTVADGAWEAFAFFVLVMAPFMLVVKTEKRSVQLRQDTLLPMGIFFSIVAGLSLLAGVAAWKSLHGPDLQAKPKLLDVEKAGGDLEEGMVRLVGQGQSRFMLSYVSTWSLGTGATMTSGSDNRSLLPVTSIAWKPQEPVRFLIASRSRPSPIGILQRNALPAYLRILVEKKGIQLADPFYVVDNDAYLATKGNWDAALAIAGFLAFVLWLCFFGIFWPFVDLRNRVRWLPRP